ncbi:HalOD1 output domain-containing protein [Halorientalis pallida]|uniref:HalOD1 output domain-containing protein n=1 Tax=Halorientalis pallida TaxID=2479928 RepID=UPI003C6EFF22
MADSPDDRIVRRTLDTDAEEPAVEVAQAVADIEDREPTDLATIFECADHVLDHLFSNPPAEEAQMCIEFSYEEYRITVHQDGTAEFVRPDA